MQGNAIMRIVVLASVFIGLTASASAGQSVRYEVSFPNHMHREAEVTVIWTDLPPTVLQVRMSRSSPGRYALHEFARNVYSVRAEDGAGRVLDVNHPDPYGWDVEGHDGTVRFSYTLYGGRTDGTYTGIDASHAHLNMPATFVWARGTENRPISIAFSVPRGSNWKVASQLQPTEEPNVFSAPHLQYFLDSPTELSNHSVRSWSIVHNGTTRSVRLALHHLGTAREADAYAAMAEKVVAEQVAMWGEPADYDFGTYTLIACYVPWAAGDGMEHRNSTVLTSSSSLAANALGLLNTLSHEFFHSWNVERLRPRDLEPFDFERANMSRALWLAEGFTSYYDALFVRRAGLIGDEQYLARLAGSLNAVMHGPGRQYASPIGMSIQAPFVDAAVSIDPNNRANTFISYYTWGSMVALGLDLSIRGRYPGRSLDDYMRALWTTFGVHQDDYAPTRTYTVEDLRATLAAVTQDSAFANEFFEQYVYGSEVPDYAALLAQAGLLLRAAAPESASIGPLPLEPLDGRWIVSGPTMVGTPAYEAGLDRGDALLSIDGTPVNDADAVQAVIQARQPGDTVAIEFEHRGVTRAPRLALVPEPRLELVPLDSVDGRLTAEAQRFREEWLGSKVR